VGMNDSYMRKWGAGKNCYSRGVCQRRGGRPGPKGSRLSSSGGRRGLSRSKKKKTGLGTIHPGQLQGEKVNLWGKDHRHGGKRSRPGKDLPSGRGGLPMTGENRRVSCQRGEGSTT